MNTTEIKPLQENKYPRHFIFFDTESFVDNPVETRKNKTAKTITREYHHLRLGVIIYCTFNAAGVLEKRYTYYFHSSDEFWNFVEAHAKRNIGLYIYAHNIKYDLANVDVIAQLKKRGWVTPFPVISHNFIMSAGKEKKAVKVREDGKERKPTFKKNLHFIDTFNYVRESLASIGKKLGIKKMEVDLFTEDEMVLFEYCENDVKIVEKFILNFIEFLRKNELGSLKYTIASTAFDVYRHSFMQKPIHYHTDKKLLKIERDGYRGGRVECFKIGELPDGYYFYLDVNSMYPTVMSQKKLPYKPFFQSGAVSKTVFKAVIERSYTIADVLVEDYHPLGIYGLKQDDKLIFPRGQFRITLHQPELERALKDNSIKDIYGFVCYDSDVVLKDYNDYFYALKKSATNKVDYEMSKLLMNSLYGRFAMRKYLNDIWTITDEMDLFDFMGEEYSLAGTFNLKKGNEIFTYYHWMDKLVRSYSDDYIPVKNTNVALAGSVTAYARMLLFEYMEKAGEGNIFYCDTDSLLVNNRGYHNLLPFIDEHELGFLKLELIADNVTVLAPKNYTIDAGYTVRTRSKGIPTSAVLTEDGKYESWRFTSFKDYLRNDANFKGRVKVVKENRLKYSKGNVSAHDGGVTPYVMKYEDKQNLIMWVHEVKNSYGKTTE